MSKLLYTDFREEGIVIRLVRGHVKLKKKEKKKHDRAFLLHGGLSNVYYNGVSRIFLRYDTIKIVRFVFIHRDCTNRSITRDFYRMFVHTASALQRMQIQRWIFDIHGHFTEYTKNDRSSKSW